MRFISRSEPSSPVHASGCKTCQTEEYSIHRPVSASHVHFLSRDAIKKPTRNVSNVSQCVGPSRPMSPKVDWVHLIHALLPSPVGSPKHSSGQSARLSSPLSSRASSPLSSQVVMAIPTVESDTEDPLTTPTLPTPPIAPSDVYNDSLESRSGSLDDNSSIQSSDVSVYVPIEVPRIEFPIYIPEVPEKDLSPQPVVMSNLLQRVLTELRSPHQSPSFEADVPVEQFTAISLPAPRPVRTLPVTPPKPKVGFFRRLFRRVFICGKTAA
jgi:hypothetical protein